MRKGTSGGRVRSRVGTAPGRSLLGSLLLHAILLGLAVVIARGAMAEESDEQEPVRLTFVEAIPEVEEPVVPEAGGGGPEAPPPSEVVEIPAPRTKRRRRRVPMVQVEEEHPDEQEEESSEELELVVPDEGEGNEEEEQEETDEGATSIETDEGEGTGEGAGTGAGSGGGSGGGTGTGSGSGTGAGAGAGQSAPIYYRAGMERPRLRSGDPPRYTRQAREAGVEGVVRVRILIGRDGRVREVRVIGSTVPLLNDEVVRTIRRWRYSPPVVEGRRVEMYLLQGIRFDRRR
jgi:protein TonB